MVTKMDELQYLKRDGFRGETMIVLPTESFLDYVEHPLVKRLYLTDVGFFPRAEHHSENEKTESKNIFICTVWRGAERSRWMEKNICSMQTRPFAFHVFAAIGIMPAKGSVEHSLGTL